MSFTRQKQKSLIALLAFLMAIIAINLQSIKPVHAWTLNCASAANLAIDQAQCEALESIYDNLGGGGWTNNTNWGTDTDVLIHGMVSPARGQTSR